MKAHRYHSFIVAVIALVSTFAIVGCDDGGGASAPSMDQLAAQIDQQKQADAAAKAAAETKAAQEAAAQKAATEAAQRQAEEEAQRQAAAAANVRQGTTAGAATVGQGGGYYSAIVGAHRHITTKVDDLAWITAVKSYWAENGHYPKSHEEFMKCLETYQTELPPLEQGEEYLYDPNEGQFGTLYTVRQNP